MQEDSIIRAGEKVLIMTRRRFDGDIRRHFAGEVTAAQGGLARVEGYVFIFDKQSTEFQRHRDPQAKLYNLCDAGHLVYLIPDEAALDAVTYRFDPERGMIVTDGRSFSIDLNEFGTRH